MVSEPGTRAVIGIESEAIATTGFGFFRFA